MKPKNFVVDYLILIIFLAASIVILYFAYLKEFIDISLNSKESLLYDVSKIHPLVFIAISSAFLVLAQAFELLFQLIEKVFNVTILKKINRKPFLFTIFFVFSLGIFLTTSQFTLIVTMISFSFIVFNFFKKTI